MTRLREGHPSNHDSIPSQTVSGAHLSAGSMGTHSSFPEVKRPRRYVHHSPHLALKLRICGAIPSLPHIPSWSLRRQLYLYAIQCVSYIGSRSPPVTNGKGSRERSCLVQGSDRNRGNINNSVSTSPEQDLKVRSSDYEAR